MQGLTYVVVTPTRNEQETLPRVAASLIGQGVQPETWVIVDTGSTDSTLKVARSLAEQHPWVKVLSAPMPQRQCGGLIDGLEGGRRAAGDLHGFMAGWESLSERPDVIVKVDADISLPADYFVRQLEVFSSEPTLGISSGTCLEKQDGIWVQRYMTGSSVWGCARAYRVECLAQIVPLEARMGWDGIDVMKAELRGWSAGIIAELTFRHHRLEGGRDGSRRAAYAAQGEAAHYMGYRPSYLLLRSLHRARRELAALAMVSGYAAAAFRRSGRCQDAEVVEYLRSQQRLRAIRTRLAEATGRHS